MEPLVQIRRGELGRHADGILDGISVGAAVADDRTAFDAQQRRTAKFGVVDPFLEVRIG